MLLPLFVGQGHVLTMLAVMLFAFAERLESAAPLGWRWRGPGKALRIIERQPACIWRRDHGRRSYPILPGLVTTDGPLADC